MAPSSLRSLLTYASNLVSQLPLALSGPQPFADVTPYTPLSGAPSCPIDGPVSCHNNTPVVGDSCCFVHPGGKLLLTQFWDEKVHAPGAEEGWTLHGLWPDRCDGSYDQFCNLTPQFHNITAVLQQYGQGDLLSFMDRYWVANSGPNSRLWTHEFNKHATCVNTLAPSCYEGYSAGLEVVDYFTRAAALFRLLDTYYALEHAGIVPHAKRHYPLADITAAIEEFSGGRVVLRCSGSGHRKDILHEVWYVYHVRGSLQTGEFAPVKDLGREGNAGNCAPWVRYLPKKTSGWFDL